MGRAAQLTASLMAALGTVLLAAPAWPATIVKHTLDTAARGRVERLANGGFSQAQNGVATSWQAWQIGYAHEAEGGRQGGGVMMHCDDAASGEQRGASQTVRLGQTRPLPIVASGWSKAEDVSGAPGSGYSIYLDITFTDGTPLWGQVAMFATGTHGWQRRQVLVVPQKPIESVMVHALFRGYSGTVWFDDLSLTELAGEGAGLFDTVPVAASEEGPAPEGEVLSLKADALVLSWDAATGAMVDANGRARGGMFVRDVIAEGEFVRIDAPVARQADGSLSMDGRDDALGLAIHAEARAERASVLIHGRVEDTTGRDRAVTAYYALPIDALGWTWGDDMRTDRTVEPGLTYHNGVNVGAGLSGYASRYPLAEVSSGGSGVALGVPMAAARLCRLAYDSSSKELYAAFDFGLTPQTTRHPSSADFGLIAYPFDGAWGFRAALQGFYDRFPDDFLRRATHEGIWMPFTDIATVQNPDDFCFAYKEGNDNVAWDDAHDILSFVYIEPMTYWMSMPAGTERTRDSAMAQVREEAAQGNRHARATLTSVAYDAEGQPDVVCLDAPWCNGAVFTLNDDPDVPAPEGGDSRWTQGWDGIMQAFSAGGGTIPGWTLASGAEVTEAEGHGQVLRLTNAAVGGEARATQAVQVNQTQPRPLIARASARALGVTGVADPQYSLYLDLTYTDGERLFGQSAPFDPGKPDWQTVELRIDPEKPVAVAFVHLLLRQGHTGTSLFDDAFLGDAASNENLLIGGDFEAAPANATAVLDGTYIDSLEGWADRPNYRVEHFAAADVPLTFGTMDRRPVILTYFSTYEATVELSLRMHAMGKLLMANATPWRFPWAAYALDAMGTETNWAPEGKWQPDPDDIFNYRRALCYHKPYLLLQNTVFDQFPPDMVERYLARSVLYGVFPSFFSHNAADDPYWQDPALYNAHRPLFRKYLPVCQRISRAGWEPITHARTNDPDVYVERFGTADNGSLHFTVLNVSSQAKTVKLSLDGEGLGLQAAPAVTELVAGRPASAVDGQVTFELGSEELAVLSVGGE